MRLPFLLPPWRDPLRVLVAALLTLGAAFAGQALLQLDQPSLIFLFGVFAFATRSSIVPALVCAVLCFLAYNLLFIEPRYSLHIASPTDAVTAAVFLAAALLAGRLGGRLSMQVQALQAANMLGRLRQRLAGQLIEADSVDQVAAAAAATLGEALGGEARLERGGPPASVAATSVEATANASDAGWQSWLLPMPSPHHDRLRLRRADGAALSPVDHALIAELAGDIAQALLRVRLAEELQSQRLANETERLRSALLASVSHDLRSPLAGIIGAASSLENYGERMPAADRRSLLETVRLEGERLDRYIQNLLDMTRLGHDSLALERDWIGIDELIASAIARAQRQWPAARFEVTIANDLAPIWVHAALVEQALFNIIENAVAFSPPGGMVRIDAGLEAPALLRIDISDSGPGIPEAERARIFDMFYSVERGDRAQRDRSGSGLGLAICRGMIGAHGGAVEALAGPGGRGSCLRVQLPLLQPAAA